MDMEFKIKVRSEVPRYLHLTIIETKTNINGREYVTRETLNDDADPVFFDYIWEKMGKHIKDSYMKSLLEEIKYDEGL